MKTSNIVYFLTCAIIWGITWIAIKFQLPYVDGSAAVFYRFIFSSSVVFAICILRKIKLTHYTKQSHLRFLSQGLFLFSLNYLLSYWASALAPSALVALAFTSLIFFNMFGGFIFLKLPIENKVFWGAIISFSGMGFITLNEYQQMNLHPSSIWGFLLSLLATISASAGNLFSTLNKEQKIPILANNGWSMFYGAIFTLIFCIATQKSFAVQITQPFIISFLYLSIFGTVLSFWAYLKLIENIGPAKAAFTSIASPVIALVVSTFYEDLQWSLFLFAGATLCILGNILALVKIKASNPKTQDKR